MKHRLYYLNNIIGKVEVVKQGLYYSVRCRFEKINNSQYSLIAVCEKGETNLGVCGEIENYLGINRCLSIHSLPGSIQHFCIREVNERHMVYSVSADKPFNHIERLNEVVLEINKGIKTIRMP